MTEHPIHPEQPVRHVQVDSDHQLVASAEVLNPASGIPVARFHLESPGHNDAAARDLVDTVVDSAPVRDTDRLTAAVPRGDEALLGRVRERFTDVTTHTAGATVIADAATRRAAPTPD